VNSCHFQSQKEIPVMKIILCVLLAACLTSVSIAQTPAQPQTPATAPASGATPPIVMHFSSGTLIRVKLEAEIDAKKAHVGDQVLAKTIDDLKSEPPGLATKGCKILGHAVEVTPHQGDTPSKLRIVFDKMILKNDAEMALPATIQAVGFAEASQTATAETPFSGGSPSKYSGQRLPNPNSEEGKLPFKAQGAIGMSGVTLSAGSEQDSILTSNKHNVKLESGMQMILRTQ
jgi:hypothetical protein